MERVFIDNKIIIALTLLIMGLIHPLLCVATLYVVIIYCIIKQDVKVLWIFIMLMVFSNLFLICLSSKFDNITTSLVLISKEVIIYMCIGIGVKKWKMIQRNTVIWLLLVGLMVITLFITSGGELKDIAIAIRQIITPFMCYYFGRQIKINRKQRDEVYDFIINSSLVISLFGGIELLVLGDTFWDYIGVEQFEHNKTGSFKEFNSVPLNFYSWDLIFFVQEPIRRLVSIFANPLVTGHYLFLGFLLLHFRENVKNRLIKKAVVGIAALLTASKGIFLMYLVFLFMYSIIKMKYGSIKKLIALFLISVFVILFAGIYSVSLMTEGTAVGNHLAGLIKGFTDTGLIGNGLGTAGANIAILGGLDESYEFIAESFMGVLTAQIGYVGFGLFVYFWVDVIYKLIHTYKVENGGSCYGLSIFLLGVLLESFFSESSITITGSGIVFVLIGIELNKYISEEKR